MSGYFYPDAKATWYWGNVFIIATFGASNRMFYELWWFAFICTIRFWGTFVPKWLLSKSKPLQWYELGIDIWCLVSSDTRNTTWTWGFAAKCFGCMRNQDLDCWGLLAAVASSCLPPILSCLQPTVKERSQAHRTIFPKELLTDSSSLATLWAVKTLRVYKVAGKLKCQGAPYKDVNLSSPFEILPRLGRQIH